MINSFFTVNTVLFGQTFDVGALIGFNLTVDHHHKNHIFQKLVCVFLRFGYDSLEFTLVNLLPSFDTGVEVILCQTQIFGYFDDYVLFFF